MRSSQLTLLQQTMEKKAPYKEVGGSARHHFRPCLVQPRVVRLAGRGQRKERSVLVDASTYRARLGTNHVKLVRGATMLRDRLMALPSDTDVGVKAARVGHLWCFQTDRQTGRQTPDGISVQRSRLTSGHLTSHGRCKGAGQDRVVVGGWRSPVSVKAKALLHLAGGSSGAWRDFPPASPSPSRR